MKHAGPAALDSLEPLLQKLRKIPGLLERKRGIFYHQGTAFLHFHEDPAGLFADLRTSADFERYPVSSAKQITRLVREARRYAAR
jgi:hypothetical protein